MRPLRYKMASWLLAFAIGVASTFLIQSCLHAVPIRSVSQLQIHPPKLPSLPEKKAVDPPEEVVSEEEDEPKRIINLKFRKYSVSEKAEDFYENVADYPQLEVLTTEKARRFNSYLENLILDRINDAKKQGRELIRKNQLKGEKNRLVGALTTTYKILYASQNIISISFDHSYEATFHPILSYESVNYDFKAGKPLQLKEIFKPHVKYLQALSKLSRIKLIEPYPSLGIDDWMKEGTAPLEKNFQAWNITPEGLIISFGDYQVGPYGMGAPSVTIPLAKLRNLLNRKYLYLS